jgi:SagB-type dehydrogenase family enzyme
MTVKFINQKMKTFLYIIIFSLSGGLLFSQDLKKIKLENPDMSRGLNVMQALEKRASASAFSSESLSSRDLSDLLWAAAGVNRTDSKKRTSPTAVNAQDIDLYVFLKEGVYLYDYMEHALTPVVKGDFRSIVAGKQPDFAKAPVFVLMVSDISRFKTDESTKMSWAAMDAGIVSQNINIFCAAIGMNTRTRAYMEQDKIRETLKLKETQYPMLNNPVSYPVK